MYESWLFFTEFFLRLSLHRSKYPGRRIEKNTSAFFRRRSNFARSSLEPSSSVERIPTCTSQAKDSISASLGLQDVKDVGSTVVGEISADTCSGNRCAPTLTRACPPMGSLRRA